MAIFVYPPVSLSITSGPLSFVQDGSTVTVREDTVDPSQNRPLPTKLIDPTSGDYISPATELKQDTIITELTTIRNKDFATETTLATIPGKIDDSNAKLDQVVADLDALNLKDFATSAKQDSLLAKDFATSAKQDTAQTSLSALVAKDFSTSAKQDSTNTKLDSLIAKDFSTSAKQDTLNTTLGSTNTKLDTLIAKDYSTSAKQDAAAVLFGAVNETAPASDTASSGLNGRLQRIAQRLTSLIAQLPATLGIKTAANSLSIAPASDAVFATTMTPASIAGTVTSSVETVGTTRSRATVGAVAPSASRKKLMVKPVSSNTGRIFIGGSTVTTATGMEIIGPDRLEFEFDSGDYYLISDTVGQFVEIVEKV